MIYTFGITDDEYEDEENEEVDYWPRSYFITAPIEDPDDPEAIEVYDIGSDD